MPFNKKHLIYDALIFKLKINKILLNEEHIMKQNKLFLAAILSTLGVSLLSGCNNNNNASSPISSKSSTISYSEEEEEDKPLEIGDTVKEWTNLENFNIAPLDLPSGSNAGTGTSVIQNDFGRYDDNSIKYELKVGNNNEGYISSDALEEPYFQDEDAKNGDVISLYYYVPADGNIASLQLQVVSISGNDVIKSDLIEINDDNTDDWNRTLITFDSLELLGSIRVYFKAIDSSKNVTFFIDDILIVYGEETVKTEYIANGESLCEAYANYDIIVGTCMPASAVRNTEMRKITKDNFNSVTAENEAKPEHIFKNMQQANQALTDKSEVVISFSEFEKIYDWCEANHIAVRHHTFVWYSQTPAWLFTEDYSGSGNPASRELMLKRMDSLMRQTIEGINERWPGLVYAIDVVNEAVGNGGAGFNKNNKWFDTIGEDFVYQAFKCAAQYKEDYQDLYYNDYDYDYNTSNCQKALSDDILGRAIREGLVDGVGIQGHVDSDQSMDVLITDAKMIHEAGLKCQITELDITINGTDESALSKQKEAYKRLMSKVLAANANEETSINGVIVWGITDNSSWKRNQNPLLFNNNYGKKPCYYGCLEAIEEFEAN